MYCIPPRHYDYILYRALYTGNSLYYSLKMKSVCDVRGPPGHRGPARGAGYRPSDAYAVDPR